MRLLRVPVLQHNNYKNIFLGAMCPSIQTIDRTDTSNDGTHKNLEPQSLTALKIEPTTAKFSTIAENTHDSLMSSPACSTDLPEFSTKIQVEVVKREILSQLSAILLPSSEKMEYPNFESQPRQTFNHDQPPAPQQITYSSASCPQSCSDWLHMSPQAFIQQLNMLFQREFEYANITLNNTPPNINNNPGTLSDWLTLGVIRGIQSEFMEELQDRIIFYRNVHDALLSEGDPWLDWWFTETRILDFFPATANFLRVQLENAICCREITNSAPKFQRPQAGEHGYDSQNDNQSNVRVSNSLLKITLETMKGLSNSLETKTTRCRKTRTTSESINTEKKPTRMISAWELEEKIRQGRIRPWMLSSMLSEKLEEAETAEDLAKRSQKAKEATTLKSLLQSIYQSPTMTTNPWYESATNHKQTVDTGAPTLITSSASTELQFLAHHNQWEPTATTNTDTQTTSQATHHSPILAGIFLYGTYIAVTIILLGVSLCSEERDQEPLRNCQIDDHKHNDKSRIELSENTWSSAQGPTDANQHKEAIDNPNSETTTVSEASGCNGVEDVTAPGLIIPMPKTVRKGWWISSRNFVLEEDIKNGAQALEDYRDAWCWVIGQQKCKYGFTSSGNCTTQFSNQACSHS